MIPQVPRFVLWREANLVRISAHRWSHHLAVAASRDNQPRRMPRPRRVVGGKRIEHARRGSRPQAGHNQVVGWTTSLSISSATD